MQASVNTSQIPVSEPRSKPVLAGDSPLTFSSIEEIVAEASAGRMFVLVDGEDRENEGDLVIPAEFATPDAINFMMLNGRGLICLASDNSIAKRLEIDLQPRRHVSEYYTAFTTSIEARIGVTTGISAHDRAHTIQVAIDPNSTAVDIATPGHIFPIIANNNGVLERPGHTEASVDIAKLAGLMPSAVVCEILGDDGKAARRKHLLEFAQKHNMLIGTVESLIKYRRNSLHL